MKYHSAILDQFTPYILESYKAKKWADKETLGPSAIVYVIDTNTNTCQLLQQLATSLYDWVAPNLPEDLTFIKNNFEWFSCTTHEEFGGFTIRTDYYRNVLKKIPGLKVEKVNE